MTRPRHKSPFTDPLEALRAILPRAAFGEEDLQEMLPLCQITSFPGDVVLIREGEPSDNQVYFLLSGSVSVSIQGRFILSLSNLGEAVGEMGLISAAPRSATVKTDEPSQFLIIDAALRMEPQGEQPYKFPYFLSRMFNAVLTEKLRKTSDRAMLYEDMVSHSAGLERQRHNLENEIARYLQQISLFSHLVGSANDSILVTDTAGRILNANPSLSRIFGIETDHIIGVEVSILLGMPDGRPGNWEDISTQARSGGWQGEVVIFHPQLGRIPADCSISSVHDTDQGLLAYSIFLRDIRERKALEEQTRRQQAELEEAYRKLQELDRAKSNFLSLVSHELRTPLTSILAYAEVLNTKDMVDEQDRPTFIDVIHKEAEKLSEMVAKVLAISKIESGEMPFNFAEHRLEEVVHEQVTMVKDRAEAKHIAIECDFTLPLCPMVFDKDNLSEALLQVLDNAIQYSDGGVIRVELRQAEHRAQITIADDGVGMEDGAIAQVLEKFGRGEAVNIGSHGLGLGLPLCYLIVKAHSGQFKLESAKGQGTTVSILLPLRPAPDSDAG
jgi:PAS domain S-box-containing protein